MRRAPATPAARAPRSIAPERRDCVWGAGREQQGAGTHKRPERFFRGSAPQPLRTRTCFPRRAAFRLLAIEKQRREREREREKSK
jgi:hypothetical protein